MARIRINNVERTEDPAWQTWGGLLDTLDTQLAPNGQIVTAVRFDGLDEAAFRDPEITARVLAGVALVEVECGTTADLVARSVQEVTAAIATLKTDTARVGEAFRRFDLATANPSLAELATKLTTLVAIVQAIGLALRINLDEFRHQNDSASAMIAELAGYVETIIAAQQAEDWIGVADVIEYDLQPVLARWHVMIEGLGTLASVETLQAAG